MRSDRCAGSAGGRGVAGASQEGERRERTQKNRNRFVLGQNLPGDESCGHDPEAAGWEALDELPSLFLSPRRSSARRLGLGTP